MSVKIQILKHEKQEWNLGLQKECKTERLAVLRRRSLATANFRVDPNLRGRDSSTAAIWRASVFHVP